MAGESKKADDIAADWNYISIVLDDPLTIDLDEYVDMSRNSVDSRNSLLQFLENIEVMLNDLELDLDPETLRSSDTLLNDIRTTIKNEFDNYERQASANIIALDWLTVSTIFEDNVTKSLDDYVDNPNLVTEDDYIKFLIDVGNELKDIQGSLDLETRIDTISELNNFRTQLNKEFTSHGLPELPLDDAKLIDVKTEIHPVQKRLYQEVEKKTKEPEQAGKRQSWHESKPDISKKDDKVAEQDTPKIKTGKS